MEAISLRDFSYNKSTITSTRYFLVMIVIVNISIIQCDFSKAIINKNCLFKLPLAFGLIVFKKNVVPKFLKGYSNKKHQQ